MTSLWMSHCHCAARLRTCSFEIRCLYQNLAQRMRGLQLLPFGSHLLAIVVTLSAMPRSPQKFCTQIGISAGKWQHGSPITQPMCHRVGGAEMTSHPPMLI